jgi:hypothetical protein
MVYTDGLLAGRLSFSIEFSDKATKKPKIHILYKITLETILRQTIFFMLGDNTFNLYLRQISQPPRIVSGPGSLAFNSLLYRL